MYTVYRINFPDGKTYVGCTKHYKARMYRHYIDPINNYAKSQIEKYGKDAIRSEILADGIPSHLKESVEARFIVSEGDRATNLVLPRKKKEGACKRISRLLGVKPLLLRKSPICYDAIINNQRTGHTMPELIKKEFT